MSGERGTIVVICGLPFAGKTTLAEAIARRLDAEVVSLDEINARRGLHGGEGVPDHEWGRSHETALAEIAERMRGGAARIVVDDTSCFRFLRDDYRAAAARHGYRCAVVVVETPLEEIRRRMDANATSGRRTAIRREVFERVRASFEWPGTDEDALVYRSPSDLDGWVASGRL